MIADRRVLRRREDQEDRLTPEGREAIRAARARQAERNRKSRTQSVVSPTLAAQAVKHRRTSYG
jgi:hypothetical protein